MAALNEWVARIRFRTVDENPAKRLTAEPTSSVVIDTEIDVMFNCPGIALSEGSQRSFTRIIKALRTRPHRKSTFTNLERVRCSIGEFSDFVPTDAAIWTSIRSITLQRKTRELFWKCMHNTFRVGDFWDHIETAEIQGRCHSCEVTESLEHIALECLAPGQKKIWALTRELWSKKYMDWPKLSWGLILGCNIVRFKSQRGAIVPHKGRLFAILISIAWHLIWNLRVDRVITNPGVTYSAANIHNRWLKLVNSALQRDRILTNTTIFGPLALKKQLVLNTWSGLLLNEDSLPDDWILTAGVLVGIQPRSGKFGIG
ncbi:hypothetical protein C8J57DRAFT_1068982 [Mycena rebaudengoi]|nr:hypothetical protein C8J57DRAFT_1068982 [Mycena rebaudengoi]